MKNKQIIIALILLTIICTSAIYFDRVDAMEISFFYSETCPYCREIKPSIIEYSQLDTENKWNLYETETNQELFKSYEFTGVPSFVINTNDGREIKFTGANLNKLNCELQEMSTQGCVTQSADSCIAGSWFIE